MSDVPVINVQGRDDVVDTRDVREHYDRVGDVVADIGTVDGVDGRCDGLVGNTGWYPHSDGETAGTGTVEEACKRLSTGASDRTLYVNTTYSSVSGRRRAYEDDDDGRHWETENPLPNYDEISAIALPVDVDLADKTRPLESRERKLVEDAIAEFSARLATVVGSANVFWLDSVGGFYFVVRPAVTAPIADDFAADDAGKILSELVDRYNDLVEDNLQDVNPGVDGDNLLDPDMVAHKNRQIKGPLSIHKSMNGVVTPVSRVDPSLSLTRVDDVDATLIDRTRDWIADFTSGVDDDARDGLAGLVGELWCEADDDEHWKTTLMDWLVDTQADSNTDSADVSPDSNNDVDPADSNSLGLTTDKRARDAAVDRLDTERVLDETIVKSWTDTLSDTTDRSATGKRAFVPIWAKGYNSGNASYCFKGTGGQWHDTSDGYSGFAAKAALIASSDHSYRPSDPDPSGAKWSEAVDELRSLGFEIPTYIGDDTDGLPLWGIVKAAESIGIVDKSDLVDRDGYQDLTRVDKLVTVRLLEARGYDTGRAAMLNDDPSPLLSLPLHEYAAGNPYADPGAALEAVEAVYQEMDVSADVPAPKIALAGALHAEMDIDVDPALDTVSDAVCRGAQSVLKSRLEEEE